MISPFRKADAIIESMDGFFSIVEESIKLFSDGIKDFLTGDKQIFNANLHEIRQREKSADALLSNVELNLYKYSLMPELRSDVMRLMQRIDDLVDTMKEVMVQFDVEHPFIPSELHEQLIQLTTCCSMSALEANSASVVFFRNSQQAKPHIRKAISLESEADDLAEQIKRRAFHELHQLTLPEKFHIRYFTLHIESVSDIAKSVVYTINLMLVKRFE